MKALALFLLSAVLGRTVPGQPTPQRVDLIELNHVIHETGPGYSQVILWVWSSRHNRHDCIGWYLVDPKKLGGLPYRSVEGDFWTAGQGKHLFRAKVFRETKTNYDPERENSKLRGVTTQPMRS